MNPIIIKGGEQVEQPPQVVAAPSDPHRAPRLQRVNTKCRTCAATLARLESTTYSHLWHWFINTSCGHSKLCQGEKWCPACAESPVVCMHCRQDACPCC